jgi:sucrose phosphorylase
MTQLITYPDSLGGNIKALEEIMAEDFEGLFDSVHILPPYPSSGDRGFAPIDYKQIDPRFGTWEDVRHLAQNYGLTLDFMVNHASAQSEMFKDLKKNGENSPYKNFFLTPSKVFGTNEPSEEDIAPLVLRRARPYSDYKLDSGESIRIWTTFGQEDPSEQLDLDIHDETVQAYYKDLLAFFAGQGIRELRMDAIAYAVKKAGTSCFFVEPEIYEFMDWIEDEAAKAGIRILHEIHAPLVEMKKLAKHGYKNYDFLLSYAILEALLVHDASLIVELLSDSDRPTNWVTLIDCHDGIPVQPDMNGVLDKDRMVETINKTEENGAIFSALHSVEKAYEDAPNVHQICGALYSLLGEDDDAFVSARAIQLFAPGSPQIYYEGLLGGTHCREGYEKTKDGRELNRRNYSREEVAEAVKRPRAQRILNLIRYRKDRKFYEGDFSLATEGGKLMMTWQGSEKTQLEVDLSSGQSCIVERSKSMERVIDL